MSRLMIVLVVLLSLAVAGLFLAKHKNASLRSIITRLALVLTAIPLRLARIVIPSL